MERECEEGEIEKTLRRSFLVGNYCKRASPSTPSPTWRLGFSPPSPSRVGAFSSVVDKKEFLTKSEFSVRKLCAELWETEQFRPPISLRRCQRQNSDEESPCGSPLHDHQAVSRGSSLRRQVDHRLVYNYGDRLQPISPASCSSRSLEVVIRKPAFSETGSSLAKSMSYGLGSSTKFLKVLNRIWSLEEQNASNMSLVKALKTELDECRAEIKKMHHQEKKTDMRIWKQKEEEELENVFRSIKKELDDERKVRKKSESMHRKLTRDLCEAKHCLTKALKDLENERKERIVVEKLCDKFARTVKDYEENEKRRSHSIKGSDLRPNHQRICLKELEEGLEKRKRRDNKLQLMKSKKSSEQVFNLSISSEGDKIYPETSPRNVVDHQSLEKSRTFSKILASDMNVKVKIRDDNHHSLKDKLMEARVESRRLRSLKPESSPSHPVQA